MYKVKKVFNNNVIYAEDEMKNEYVLMGKGIGFRQSSGNQISGKNIQKKFKLDTKDQAIIFGNLLNEVNESYFSVVEEVILIVKDELNVELHDYIYFSLADHLEFAIQRSKQDIVFRSPIQWEIQQAYPKAYSVAKKAVTHFNKKLNINLPNEEYAFIALHIINAINQDGESNHVLDELESIQEILRIVKVHFKIEFNESTVNFERFMTHLRFFVQRLRADKQLSSNNNELYKKAVSDWPHIYECTHKIAKHIKKSKNIEVSDEEMFYLILHLNRLIDRDEKGNYHGKTNQINN